MSTGAARDRRVAWAYVGVQAVLLVGLLIAPKGTLWSTGGAAVRAVGAVLVLGGLTLAAVAAWGIRRGLTALPLPALTAELQTGGAYRRCRHPIYLGVLIAAAGVVVTRASVVAIILFLALTALFEGKARFEERQLRARFASYAAYAARTPRLLPWPRRRASR